MTRALALVAVMAVIAGCEQANDSPTPLYTIANGVPVCAGETTLARDPVTGGVECRFDRADLGRVTCEWLFLRVERDVLGAWVTTQFEGHDCH